MNGYIQKQSQLKRQQRLVADWNAKFLVGQAASVRLDSGAILETKTTSAAWLLGGHTAVIKVDGIVGGYALERCTAVDKHAEVLAYGHKEGER